MTSRALIGYTGFVGSNLEKTVDFSHKYNSKNFTDMAGSRFGEIWCAGTTAVKWSANRSPEEDWNGIHRLVEVLNTVRADQFVLISTVDVFRTPVGVDEDSPVETDGLDPYGLHRYRLEEFVRSRFPAAFVFRLPNIYGPGFYKNALYDLMNDHRVDHIDSEMRLQFYDVARLSADVQRVIRAGHALMHLATEPLRMGDIADRVFGYRAFDNRLSDHPPVYDMGTIHAALFGARGRYILDAETSMHQIEQFVRASQGRGGDAATA